MAVGTHRLAAVPAHQDTVLNLVLILLDHLEKGIDTYPVVNILFAFRRKTMPQPVFLCFGKFVVGLEDGEVDGGGTPAKLIVPNLQLLAMPALYAAFVDTERGVGNDKTLVDSYHIAKALAGGACAGGTVEGEHVLVGFLKANAVGLERRGEVVGDLGRQKDEPHFPVPLIEGGLRRVIQAVDDILFRRNAQAVDDQIQWRFRPLLRVGVCRLYAPVGFFPPIPPYNRRCVQLLHPRTGVCNLLGWTFSTAAAQSGLPQFAKGRG